MPTSLLPLSESLQRTAGAAQSQHWVPPDCRASRVGQLLSAYAYQVSLSSGRRTALRRLDSASKPFQAYGANVVALQVSAFA